MKKGTLFVISAPSGAGKTTLCSRVMNLLPDISFSISHTTRHPRDGEVDGQHYHFITVDGFMAMVEQEMFLEWAEVHGNFYGTSRKAVNMELEQGHDVIMDIDVQGAMQIKQRVKNAIFIFILPPSMEELEKRLRRRKTEPEDVMKRRLANAASEIKMITEYDYTVINDEIDRAAGDLASIFRASRCRTSNIVGRLSWIHPENTA